MELKPENDMIEMLKKEHPEEFERWIEEQANYIRSMEDERGLKMLLERLKKK